MVIMKSSTTMNTVNSESSGIESGRVTKIRHNNNTQLRSLENEEIQMYLSKLKELVPFMPKNRKLSKLEVIQYVIDYICDLQSALDTNPALSAVAVAAAAVNSQSQSSSRQPLGVIPPNTICASLEQNSVAPLGHLTEKVVTPTDTRPVSSC